MTVMQTQGSAANELPGVPQWVWVSFIAFTGTLLFLDLFVFNRGHKVPTLRRTLLQIGFFVSSAVFVGLMILFATDLGGNGAGQYFAAYLIEWSLSVDNIFVIALVMTFFKVPKQFEHKVLFWGVMGAIVMRLTFIVLGIALIQKFSWVVVILGAFLIYSGAKLITSDDDDVDVKEMKSYKLFTRFVPTTKDYQGAHFFSRAEGVLKATPLFLTVLVVEVTDLIFAVDSVPAVLAITSSTFIAFSSNVMAILGLRAIYFLFSYVKDKLSRLNEGLAIILIGVGIKMIVAHEFSLGGFEWSGYHLPTWASLAFIGTVLVGSVVASIVWPKEDEVEIGLSDDENKEDVDQASAG